MKEFCSYCQADVELWDEGDGIFSCPSCLNVLAETKDDELVSKEITSTSHEGTDIWDRSTSYTWGSGVSSWWQGGLSGSSLSSGWSSGTTIYNSGWSADKGESYRMMKHKNHLDGLAKIVDPTIKHTLDYATESQSYCNMATGNIRVDGSLILEDDDKLDVVAGLAIHEKLHLVHSKPLHKHLKYKRYDIMDEHGSFGFDQRYVVENKDRPPRDDSSHGGYLDDWDRFLMFSGIEKPSRANYKANHPDWENGLGAFAWPLEEHLQPDMFVGRMAVQVINRRTATNPLFLEIGFPGPHPPYDPPQRHLELYDDVSIPIPTVTDEELSKQPLHHALQREWCLEGNHDAVNWQLNPSDDQLLRLRRHYAANVTSIDEQVGNIISALDEKRMLENSVIVFMSDHGDCTGDHGHIQKWVMYDAVTRIPAIVWSPGRVPEGKRTDALIQHMDLAPMLFDLAGIEVPKHTGAECALPNGDTEFAGRDAVFCELKGREDYLVMVRTHEWKLVSYLDNGDQGELYDLNRDPAELQNLWNDPKLSEIQMTLLDRIRIWHTAQSNGD